ncbi:MAG: sugar ABC transporter ATP-binding protein [Planctomycetes bacterium]|nr:sugar ABC transporter ATP-binding protein [Planctomycetota bacterium]
MPDSGPLLTIAGLWKSYAAVALADVSFDLRRGEVHALVGENGAGKSTLARIIAGVTRPDSGAMRLGGEPYAPRSKREAEGRGVRLVMQELNLIGPLTIAESIFFGRLPHRGGWIDYRRLDDSARGILERVGLGGVDPARPVGTLGIGQKQLVEIAAGLSRRCDILILDEPTAALTDPEIERLFQQIARLKAEGTGIVYISHRLEEVRRISDRVSILRDGRGVATRPAGEMPLGDMVRLMVGRELGEAVRRSPRPAGPAALRVSGLRRPPAVCDVSFEVREGEILGFAGLMGSGRTEAMRAIFGADRAEAGEIYLHGSAAPVRLRSPRQAVRRGLAFLTENRKEEGLLLTLPIRANITLANLQPLSRLGGWIRRRRERAEAERLARALDLRARSLEQPAAELSGGNQQKAVVAKWLFRDCDILIFDEPTRGIDIGGKFEIYRLLAGLAEKGKAVILVSSDLKELLALSDRIAVMSAGRVAATFNRGEWSEEKILAAALSGHLEKRQGAGGGS